MTKHRLIQLDDQQLADTMEEAVIHSSLDVGVALVHCGNHPVHGPVTIVSTFSGINAMVIL